MPSLNKTLTFFKKAPKAFEVGARLAAYST